MEKEGRDYHLACIKTSALKTPAVYQHPLVSGELDQGGITLSHIKIGYFQVPVKTGLI
jgi:hypothetical protein